MIMDTRTIEQKYADKILQRVSSLGFGAFIEFGGQTLGSRMDSFEELALYYSGLLFDPHRQKFIEGDIMARISIDQHPIGRAGHDSFMHDLALKLIFSEQFIQGLMKDSQAYKGVMLQKHFMHVEKQID